MNNIRCRTPSPSPGDGAAKSAAAVELRQLLKEKFPEAQARCETSVGPGADYGEQRAGADGGKNGDCGNSRVREEMGATTCAAFPLPSPERRETHEPGQGDERFDGGRFLRTGVAALDATGLEKGAITEMVADPNSACGAGLVIAGVVREAAREGRFVALVDARDAFDPRSLGAAGAAGAGEGCRSLLWVRCGEVGKALQATDFLLRDGNLPLVVLDLQLSPDRELGRVPGSTWFRLRSLAEQTGAPLLTITPRPLVPCARLRLGLPGNAFALAAVEMPRAELEAALRPEILRRRGKVLYESAQVTTAAAAARMAG